MMRNYVGVKFWIGWLAMPMMPGMLGRITWIPLDPDAFWFFPTRSGEVEE